MNLEEVKRAGPSFPADIQLGFEAYCKHLDEHPEYEISEGDLLLFVVSRVSGELTATSPGIYRTEGKAWRGWEFLIPKLRKARVTRSSSTLCTTL